jgi:AraC-like DNA-binding protein
MLLTQSTFHSQSYPLHAHDGYSISLVTEGMHRFVIEGETMTAMPGEIRIIHPYEKHATQESTWSHINLSVETDWVERHATMMDVEHPVLFVRLIRDEGLRDMMETLHVAHGDHRTEVVNDTLKAIIHTLLTKHLFVSKADPTVPLTGDMIQAREYIHAHAHDSALSLEEVARRAHMSKYHFLRRFKQAFGRTPHQYLQNIRIDCVRSAMVRGETLAVAAHSCGFYDQSHMIRIYRKFYGHTPGAIQRKKAQ